MKAAVLEGVNMPLVTKEVPKPILEAGEVLVRVKAAAFNHRDLWIRKGQYAGLVFPCILGSDGSGIVEEVADTTSKHLVGNEVLINPSLNWGPSERHQAKDYMILGLPKNGCFAEYVAIPQRLVHPKPAHLSFEQAAALPLAGLTGFRAAMKRAAIKQGETVLVTGIGGGVALFCMQFAIAAGCKVYVTSGSEEKLAQALNMGATGGANYKEEGWAKKLQQQSGGFDAIVDSAGGDTFGMLIDIAKPGGRIAFYGATNGPIQIPVPAKVFWKQLDILGSTMGTDAEFEEMLTFVNAHQIVPVVSSTYALDQAETALQLMQTHAQFGKIVLQVG